MNKFGGETMNIKGQGALEYLLILAGAVLIAAIVLSLLSGTANQTGDDVDDRVELARCAPFDVDTCDEPAYTDFDPTVNPGADCAWDSTVGANGTCLPV